MAPLVSVLLPVRDAAGTLDRCLTSLTTQTLGDIEVVAIDDGSADGSGGVLDAWAARDPRVRVSHTPARGLVAALNRAADEARAPVLARMDADDVCARERLETQLRRFHAGGVDILGARVAARRADGPVPKGMSDYVAWQNALLTHDDIVGDLWVESPLAHPTVMFGARTLRALGGYRDFDGPEDYDLWLRARRAGLRFGKVPEVLVEWWDSSGRLTRIDDRYREDCFFDLKVATLVEEHLSSSREVVIWGAGPIGKRWSRALTARGHAVRAFVEVDPRKIGTRIHQAVVIAVDAVPQLGPALHLAAVGQPGRRAAIRSAALAFGLRPTIDMIAVA